MIIVFPILTDESISPNVIPGLCKSVEKFLLIYEMDAIAKMIGQKVIRIGMATSSFLNSVAKAKPQNESMFLVNETPSGTLLTGRGGSGTKPIDPDEKADADERGAIVDAVIKRTRDEEARQREIDKLDLDRAKTQLSYQKGERDRATNLFNILKGFRETGSIDFRLTDTNSISLEPTYAFITTSTGTKVIGIKVIPTRVNIPKGSSLSDLMLADLSLDFWNSKLTKYKRKLIRGFWAVCRSIRIVPFLSSKARGVISGDPEKDILLASTFHKKYVFCLLNYNDMKNSEFFKNAGGINKLHKLGWSSIIAADDVNKRIFWCMKQFHGLCSTTPYSFIYSSLGGDQQRAYTDLEDVRRTAGSIFGKGKASIKKLFGESKSVVGDYLKRID